VGTSNQFANAACQAVANSPGETYNPLFLYSHSGLGKTHLLHAIVHQCLKKNKNTKIYYVTSEQFTNELINSIRYNKMLDFRNKYRNIDVLLLDDIQFIAGKERTQEEFFHTFNSLFELKKQIVVTSDTSPREINKLEERIRSRFQWGLIADMQPPETETRVAILKKKALEKNISLTNDVAFLLANSVTSNIRELEGLLTRLTAFSSLMGQDITVDFTKDVLKDFIKTDDRETTPEEIQKTVSKYYNIKLSDLKGKKKSSSIVLPRQIAMYLTRQLTTLSLPEVGQQFSGKDHSTVIYSVKKIEGLIKKDKKIKNDIDQLLKKF
jgi:chromosomal replication initiator protein